MDRPDRARLGNEASRVEISIEEGDITRCRVDAIVNAANSALLGGGGVDGAIHRAGGPEILAVCRGLRATSLVQGLPTGRAVATTAGRLPARWVIHTAGPVYSEREDRTELLRSCYRESLGVADDLGAADVAFPLISAGVYGWPANDAIRQALDVLRATPTTVERARLVLYGPTLFALARDVLHGPRRSE